MTIDTDRLTRDVLVSRDRMALSEHSCIAPALNGNSLEFASGDCDGFPFGNIHHYYIELY